MIPRPRLRLPLSLPILLVTAGTLLLCGWFLYRQYQDAAQWVVLERLTALEVALRASTAFAPGGPRTHPDGVDPAVEGGAVLVRPGLAVPFERIHDTLLCVLPAGDYAILRRHDQAAGPADDRNRTPLVASGIHPDYLVEDPAVSPTRREWMQSPIARALQARLRRDPRVQADLAAGVAVARPLLIAGKGYVAAFVPLSDRSGRQRAYVFGFTSAPALVSMRNAAWQVAALAGLPIVLVGAAGWLLLRRGRQLELEIAQRRRDERDLRLAASVFANSGEGILVADADNRIVKVNPAFERITGFTQAEVVGNNPRILNSGRQEPEFYARMWESLKAHDLWRGEIWNQRKNGEVYPEMLSISVVRDDRGRPAHYIGVFTDIGQLKAHEAELERIAHWDPLTGLPNRRLFADRLRQAVARSRRNGQHLAVCYLDLDGFKAVNDEFGHAAGDALLAEVAKRLQAIMRESDTVARLGGDEFVLLLTGLAAPAETDPILERLLQTLGVPVPIADTQVEVTASIGVTHFPCDDCDADTLLRHADRAMYRAKAAGKNRYHLFVPQGD